MPAPGFADYVLDLLAASEARVLERLRALERRAFDKAARDDGTGWDETGSNKTG